jgi:hypothetical protein
MTRGDPVGTGDDRDLIVFVDGLPTRAPCGEFGQWEAGCGPCLGDRQCRDGPSHEPSKSSAGGLCECFEPAGREFGREQGFECGGVLH